MKYIYGKVIRLLIVPEGIEIRKNTPVAYRVFRLLIVPEGIEILRYIIVTFGFFLLIVPEGIEIRKRYWGNL